MIESYQLIRSDRRTLAIGINRDGTLVVRAPKGMPQKEIEAFLLQKWQWIEKKQSLAHSRTVERFVPENGACLPWLDATLTIRLCRVPMAIDFHGFLLVPDQGDAKGHILAWRKARAWEVLAPRVQMWAKETRLTPSSLSFGTAHTRWGSMSCSGALRLNLALLHCPMELIDYVIVHELTHLLEMNHSPAFHARVRAVLPDADARAARLKTLSGRTSLLNEKKEK